MGLHLLRRSYFLPLTKKRRRLCSTSGGRRGLTGRCGRAPWRAPSPSTQTFNNYPTISDLRRLLHLRLHLPGPKNSPVYIQSLPEHCLKLKKIKKISFKQRSFFKKNTQYTEPAPYRKPPQGGLTQAKKEKQKQKK